MQRPRVPRGLRAEKAGGSGPPAPTSSPTLPRCPGPRAPGTATTSWRRSLLHSRWLPATIRAVRPAAIGWGGRPCSPACFRRHQQMRGGRLRIIAALNDPASIRCYLTGVGLCRPSPGVALCEGPAAAAVEFSA